MHNPSQPVTVRHNPRESRYEVEVEGRLAVLDYVVAGERILFTRTFVPPEGRGRGIAEKLVRTALADARRDNRLVVPQCSYVERFIEAHREFCDLLAG